MNNSNYSGNRHNEHLGVNKMGKNIRKSPLHQPNFGDGNNKPQPPQPHVYNISKNEFRDMVQQLTGSPSHGHPPPPRPTNNPPKPPSMRLQRIRPPPLTPINQIPLLRPPSAPAPQFNNNFIRPPVPQQGSSPLPPVNHGETNWAESPISAYMRYLHNSMNNPSPMQAPPQPQHQHQFQHQPPAPSQSQHQFQHQAPAPYQAQQQFQHQAPPPSQVEQSSAGLLPTPHAPPPFPSPRGIGPALLPSPTSQFALPSPTAFLNLFSPRSPYPLLSPGFQYPPPLTPGFFSPLSHSGILGPGPPSSPSQGLLFPPSPSGLFPMSSPKWRNQ